MDSFDKREEGFERAFSHQEELRFRVRARRNRQARANGRAKSAGFRRGRRLRTMRPPSPIARWRAPTTRRWWRSSSRRWRTSAVSEHRIRRRFEEFERRGDARDSGRALTRERRKPSRHLDVDLALERDDEIGQRLPALPAPRRKFGRMRAARWALDVDLGFLALEAEQEPFLCLPAIAPAEAMSARRPADHRRAIPALRRAALPSGRWSPRKARGAPPTSGSSPSSMPPCGICHSWPRASAPPRSFRAAR